MNQLSMTTTQMVGRICDYVGAYINAARFGSDALKQRRSEIDDEHGPHILVTMSNWKSRTVSN